MKEGGDLDDTIKASRKKTKNEGNLGISAILFLKKKTRAQDRHQSDPVQFKIVQASRFNSLLDRNSVPRFGQCHE